MQHLFQARDSVTGEMHYWVSRMPDASEYPGPNTPEELALLGTTGAPSYRLIQFAGTPSSGGSNIGSVFGLTDISGTLGSVEDGPLGSKYIALQPGIYEIRVDYSGTSSTGPRDLGWQILDNHPAGSSNVVVEKRRTLPDAGTVAFSWTMRLVVPEPVTYYLCARHTSTGAYGVEGHIRISESL